MANDAERLKRAYEIALAALLAERQPDGHWTGELSTSALSTATAVGALALVHQRAATGRFADLISGGLSWLAAHQNRDGGWGDTVRSVSNISTTMLGRAAFHLADASRDYPGSLRRAENYLEKHGGKTAADQAEAVRCRYGKDRTFAVPILTTCALAGLVSWNEVAPLPFELACLPQAWFRFLRLPVVSYALPALIAIGQAVYRHRPPRNPVTRLIRRLALRKSLCVLHAIQPSSGGFLEAVPLTSFVTLSLASIGLEDHPVAIKGVQFLVNAMRPDGSWPIDSNLATWVTTLAVNALASADELGHLDRRPELYAWLAGQQLTQRHAYTGAEPGGFGWTPLPGSVPDADDTPGAIIALDHLEKSEGFQLKRAQSPWHGREQACNWLLDLQNADGGWPTFCRGWGTLPFDRSGTDLTAHNLRALVQRSISSPLPRTGGRGEQSPLSPQYGAEGRNGKSVLPEYGGARDAKAVARGLAFLSRTQRPNGSWRPLWFGNQFAPAEANPTYGTARVLAAYRDLDMMNADSARRGVVWLLGAQNPDGGWGGDAGVASSVEETALAVEALVEAGPHAASALNNGLTWLVQQVESGGLDRPTPIGFYFAKLWYFEKLYPIIFTVAALGRALKSSSPSPVKAFCVEQP
jgi:squalene-hopene/tetraprenyl-beta-curcumene cyclase